MTSSHKDQLWESALKKIVHTMNSRFVGLRHFQLFAVEVEEMCYSRVAAPMWR